MRTGLETNEPLKKTCQPHPVGQPAITETVVMKNEITITRHGIVVSKHARGVVCAYDSRHRILKVPLEGGAIAELVQERTSSGSTISNEFRSQLLTVNRDGDASVIWFTASK